MERFLADVGKGFEDAGKALKLDELGNLFGLGAGEDYGNIDDEEGAAPAGVYQVVAKVYEAKEISGLIRFSLIKSLQTFSIKKATNVISEDRLPAPFVKVSIDRGDGTKTSTQKTERREPTSSPLFGSLFFFDNLVMGEGELSGATISFRVYDHHKILGDILIGGWETDLETVYSLTDHELFRKWVPLVDQRGYRQNVQGQLLLSVTVLGPGDKPPIHSLSEESEEPQETGGGDLALSAGKAVDTFVVKASLWKAVEIPRMDLLSSASDVQMRMQCGSAKMGKSRVKNNTASPVWNQEVSVEVRCPKGNVSQAPPVRISIVDVDVASAARVIASMRLTVASILRNKKAMAQPRWYSLYGAPREIEIQHRFTTAKSKLTRRMNAGYVPGSDYRGRVLMAFEAGTEREIDRPRKKIPAPYGFEKDREFMLLCEALKVELSEPEDPPGSRLALQVSLGKASGMSQFAVLYSEEAQANKDGHCTWMQRLQPFKVTLPPPFEGEFAGHDAPDVLVNIMSKSGVSSKPARLGFVRIPTQHLFPTYDAEAGGEAVEAAFGGLWAVNGWFELTPDPLSKRRSGSSSARLERPLGKVLVRLLLQAIPPPDEEEGGGLLSPSKKKRRRKKAADDGGISGRMLTRMAGLLGANTEAPPIKMQYLKGRQYKLRVMVYQARNLPSSDIEGGSDPYCIVRVGRQVAQTQVCENTTTPGWFAELEFNIEIPVSANKGQFSLETIASRLDAMKVALGGQENTPLDQMTTIDPAIPDLNVRPVGAFDELEESVGSEFEDVRTPADPGSLNPDGGGGGEGGGGEEMMGSGANGEDDEDGAGAGDGEDEEVLEGGMRRVKPGRELWWAAPIVSFTVMDYDTMTADDPLGQCSIQLSEEHVIKEEAKRDHNSPSWNTLKPFTLPKGSIPGVYNAGEILVAFELHSLEGGLMISGRRRQKQKKKKTVVTSINTAGGFFTSAPQPEMIRGSENVSRILHVQTVPVEVQVLVMGARDLESRGLGLSSPKISFQLAGILPLEDDRAEYLSTETDRSNDPVASDPNYLEIYKLCGRVPLEALCEPCLSVRVIDSLLGNNMTLGQVTTKLRLPDLSFRDVDMSSAMLDEEEDDQADQGDESSMYSTERGSLSVDTMSSSGYLSESQGSTADKSFAKDGSAATTLSKTERSSVSSDFDGDWDLPGGDLDGGEEIDLGFGETPEYLLKRPMYDQPLEDVLEEPEFLRIPIERLNISDGQVRKTGLVKYKVRVVPLRQKPKDQESPDDELEGIDEDEENGYDAEALEGYNKIETLGGAPLLALAKIVQQRVSVVVRCYIIRGINLRPVDSNNKADPYVLGTIGSRRVGSRNAHLEATLNPPFYQMFEFPVSLPGPSQFKLAVYDWDKDALGGLTDDFIGETTIDLEDRWYAREWRQLPLKPVEIRPLYNKVSPNSQGTLELFLEIWPASEVSNNPPYPSFIRPKPMDLEMRVIVWQARNMEAKDVTLNNDLFFKLALEGIDSNGNVLILEKQTDTHWFSGGGLGYFNYRLVIDFQLPLAQAKLKLSGWDRDPHRNEVIGEASIRLNDLLAEMARTYKKEGTGAAVHLVTPNSSGVGKQWVELYYPNKPDLKGEVEISLSILHKTGAEKRPVGEGQDEPNRDPKLDEPERQKLDLMNPMASLAMIVGPARLRQILILGGIVLVIGVGGFIFLMLFNDVLSAEIDSVLGGGGGGGG
mmetsp:Transcript_22852/g.74422  ORF Transcript_22852/g.74422 Transcript_22852/m.74422 type:complete len:1705 (+) Transcript_22852:146-5260(+)